MTATDQAAFLKAICAEPEDDTPRLVYADWLDEQGDADRAEFIRVQCELAHDPGREKACRETCQPPDFEGCPQRALCRREKELLSEHETEWRGPILGAQRLAVDASTWVGYRSVLYFWPAEFRRGFVGAITCSWQDWRTHHAALLLSAPLTAVRFTTWPELEYVKRVGLKHTVRLRGMGRLVNASAHDAHRIIHGSLAPPLISQLLVLEWPRLTFGLPE